MKRLIHMSGNDLPQRVSVARTHIVSLFQAKDAGTGNALVADFAAKQPSLKRKEPLSCTFAAQGLFLLGGSYRDRTDDIHGVNVALYQLS